MSKMAKMITRHGLLLWYQAPGSGEQIVTGPWELS
jgi:hypothetical protein